VKHELIREQGGGQFREVLQVRLNCPARTNSMEERVDHGQGNWRGVETSTIKASRDDYGEAGTSGDEATIYAIAFAAVGVGDPVDERLSRTHTFALSGSCPPHRRRSR
jgi:hypothetical protein